jgi:hypothetical protein
MCTNNSHKKYAKIVQPLYIDRPYCPCLCCSSFLSLHCLRLSESVQFYRLFISKLPLWERKGRNPLIGITWPHFAAHPKHKRLLLPSKLIFLISENLSIVPYGMHVRIVESLMKC